MEENDKRTILEMVRKELREFNMIPFKNLLKEEFDNFHRKYLSFRAMKITDTATDSFGVNNKTSGSVPDNSVGQAQMKDDAIGKAELNYELATLAFGAADTSKTASITTASQIIGFYASVVTGAPASSDLLLEISGTTLTGTRVAPGVGTAITYVVILLKA
jgi:hypothetical protein